MRMRMILPAGRAEGNAMNTGPNNGPNNGGGMNNGMTQHMPYNQPMPGGGASPHAMPHHQPQQNGHPGMAMAAGNPGMMAGGYPSQGYANNGPGMEMGMASIMPVPGLAAPHSQHAPQARQMGFAAPMEDYGGPDAYEAEARRRRSRRTGRFIRGAGDGYDMEMRGGSWGDDSEDDGEEMGHASSKPAPGIKSLKKKIKALEKKLEALQEALEEEDGGKKGKKGKQSKPEEAEDEDEEDESKGAGTGAGKDAPDLSAILADAISSKEFLKRLPDILRDVLEVIKNPPPTWPPYLAKNDLSGIFVMEARELTKALDQYKAGQKQPADVLKEMKHAGAALVQMYASLLHSIDT